MLGRLSVSFRYCHYVPFSKTTNKPAFSDTQAFTKQSQLMFSLLELFLWHRGKVDSVTFSQCITGEQKGSERDTKVNGVTQPTSAKAPFEGYTDFLLRVKGTERIPSAQQIPMKKIDTRSAYILSPENITSYKCAFRWLHRCLPASLVKEADPATFFSKGYL